MHYTLYIINLYKIYFRKELYYNMLNNRNYNQIERNALDKKMSSPEKIVICPRCGQKINIQNIWQLFRIRMRNRKLYVYGN